MRRRCRIRRGSTAGLLAWALLAPAPALSSDDPSPWSAGDLATELSSRAPGVQVAVWRDGRLADSAVAGWADAEHTVPVAAQTLFPVLSAAKAWTVVALGSLLQAGAIALEAPITDHLPEFDDPRGVPTAMQLATHTGGVRHYRDPSEADLEIRCASVDEALPLFVDDPLIATPGTEQHYSSWGFVLLSAVLEAAAGEPFDALLTRTVLAPAGMESTFHAARAPEGRATVSYRSVDGGFEPVDVEPSCKWGAGGYLATATDLVRFYGSLHAGGLLPPPLALQVVRPDAEGLFRFGGRGTGGRSQIVGDWGRGVFVAVTANADLADVDVAALATRLLESP